MFSLLKFKSKCRTFSDLARGSMGEFRAFEKKENFIENWADFFSFVLDDFLDFLHKNVYLSIFCVDKFKYVHVKALGYNNCKFNSTLEAALMINGKKGEKNI